MYLCLIIYVYIPFIQLRFNDFDAKLQDVKVNRMMLMQSSELHFNPEQLNV